MRGDQERIEAEKKYAITLKKDEWGEDDVWLLFHEFEVSDNERSLLWDLIRSSLGAGKLKSSRWVSVNQRVYFDPIQLIEWAIAKQLKFPEKLLDWYEVQNKPKYKEIPPYLDASHPMHSKELKIAIEAWMAVLESSPSRPKTGSRKQLIENWLKTHHPKLLKSEVDRIAPMLNPDKTGGAPSTEENPPTT